MVRINGENRELDGKTLMDCLTAEHYDPGRVAVELNDEIVPKTRYADTVLADGDTVEIVHFVGGG